MYRKWLKEFQLKKIGMSGKKLSEGVFEFIYLQKLDKKSEFELIKKLATLDKDYLHTYLDDEEYLKIEEVRNFVFNKNKW